MQYHCCKHNHFLDGYSFANSKVVGRCTDGRVWTKYVLPNGCYFISTDVLTRSVAL